MFHFIGTGDDSFLDFSARLYDAGIVFSIQIQTKKVGIDISIESPSESKIILYLGPLTSTISSRETTNEGTQ